MTTWRLLRRDDTDSDGTTWMEVGTHQSEHDWSIGYNAAAEIGSTHGAGEYLLLHDERVKEVRIGERREFFEVDEDEPETVEAVSLEAVHPNADEVMRRDG